MPAAHMLAMTWFKSTHRSWYFSCYAGNKSDEYPTLHQCEEIKYFNYVIILKKKTFLSSCKCRLLFDGMDRDGSSASFR